MWVIIGVFINIHNLNMPYIEHSVRLQTGYEIYNSYYFHIQILIFLVLYSDFSGIYKLLSTEIIFA